MKQNHFPGHVQAALDRLAQTAEHLAQQLARTTDGIASARSRLSGGFDSDQQYGDTRASLDQLVAARPMLERKLNDAKLALADARAWLDTLPDGAQLEPVAVAEPDGTDLATLQFRIRDAEDEMRRLRAVPVPSPDIRERVREYVSQLARPQVTGIASGQQLRVSWPSDVAAVLALLHPDEMTSALLKEIDRLASLPMPLPQRKRRIAELQAEIDTLQRQALALGAGTSGLPPAVVLGVRVASRSSRAA